MVRETGRHGDLEKLFLQGPPIGARPGLKTVPRSECPFQTLSGDTVLSQGIALLHEGQKESKIG